MKENAPNYQPIPHEQLLSARQADLAAYLIARGEPLIPSGARHKHAEHDSLVFTGNAYYWNAQKEHGNAVDFLQRFYKMSFREAILELTSGATTSIAPPPTEKKTFDFSDIELAPDMELAIFYLNKTRGLSVELITGLIRRRQLFQEAQTNALSQTSTMRSSGKACEIFFRKKYIRIVSHFVLVSGYKCMSGDFAM